MNNKILGGKKTTENAEIRPSGRILLTVGSHVCVLTLADCGCFYFPFSDMDKKRKIPISPPPTLVSQFGMKTLGVVRTLYLDGITLWTL